MLLGRPHNEGSLFLLVDGAMKLAKPEPVVTATVQLGYSERTIVGMGFVLLVCVVLYLGLRTSVLGAILLTGLLGWRSCNSRARRRSILHPHVVPGLSRSAALGRAFPAGFNVAHAPSLAAFCRVVANCDKTQAQHHDVAGSVTRLCVSDPLIMPVILGVRVWDGLFLREPRLRALIPL